MYLSKIPLLIQPILLLLTGKVPVLDTGSQVIPESLVIADYLDQEYPEPPLYPKDEKQKKLDKELIASFDKIITSFYSAIFNKDNKPLSAYADDLRPHLQKFEQELEKRGGN